MDTKRAIQERKTTRDYEDKPITEDQIKELFEHTKLAPSSFNLKPWEFIIVQEKANKKKLKELAFNQKQIEESAATIIVLANTDFSAYAERLAKGTDEEKKSFVEKFKQMNNTKTEEEKKIWAITSTQLAAMTLIITAQSTGLNTGTMGGYDAEAIKKEYDIPKSFEVAMLITMGYGKENPNYERPERRNWKEITHFEKYNS